MTTLREWLNRLKRFDPDDWGEITRLQAAFSEEELNGELEAEIAFDTVGGTVEHVTIRLIDNSQDTIVDLDYTVFQLDVVPLTFRYFREGSRMRLSFFRNSATESTLVLGHHPERSEG